MALIDTHSHIYQEDFDADLSQVITNARNAGVSRILMPNIDLESVERMHVLSERYPEYCLPMMGLHPTSVTANHQTDLTIIKNYFSERKYIAVGEIGIDLYWDKTYLKEQIETFEEQLRWSIELDLPVVIHNRDAFSYVIESIKKVGAHQLRGIFHSFGGTQEELEEILGLEDFLIGVNGVVTFKNSKAGDTIRSCPLDKIVVETDAPYLAPVPYRGKRNEPAYILKTAEKLAELFQINISQICDITTTNADKMFRL